jgi:transcriptional regulator of arginine metabolism
MASSNDAKERLEALRKILVQGALSTQDELREKLEKLELAVNQSTISRDLRKLGAIKVTDPAGRTVYRLPDDVAPALPVAPSSLSSLVLGLKTNGSIIVIQTSPGSASLVARHLDHVRPGGILGTLAGDDTIFVAPPSIKNVRQTMREIEASLQ